MSGELKEAVERRIAYVKDALGRMPDRRAKQAIQVIDEQAALLFQATEENERLRTEFETSEAVITDLTDLTARATKAEAALAEAEERERAAITALKRILPHTKYPMSGTLYDATNRLEHIKTVVNSALKETSHAE